METTKQKEKKVFNLLKDKYNYKNIMAAPRFIKVVVSSGTGSGVKRDKNYNDFVIKRLSSNYGTKSFLREQKNQLLVSKFVK